MKFKFSNSSKCERARSWSSQSIDNEISDFEQLQLRRHLSRCSECAAFAKDILATTYPLREADQLMPSRRIIITAIIISIQRELSLKARY